MQNLQDIIKNGLCIGCGLCQSLAGSDRVSLVMTPEGRERPLVTHPPDKEILEKINAVCPGIKITGPESKDMSEMDLVWGPAARIVIGYAADPEIRFMSATGGVLSALGIFLLESGKVDYILHVAQHPEKPMRSLAHISRNRDDIMAGSGSHYGPTAPLTCIMQLLDQGRPFAVIAKPCDIGALRNLSEIDPRVDKLLICCLAMVCGGASEFTKSLDLIAEHGLKEEDVSHIRYRGFGNPGPTTIQTNDGRVFEHSYNEMWKDEGNWRIQNRCKICPDAIGELADLAVSDVWPGGAPTGEDDGFNGILARTPSGLDLLEETVNSEVLMISEKIGFRDMDKFQPHQVRKKKAVHDRLLGISDCDLPVPEFNNLRLEELAGITDKEVRIKNREGMAKRIMSGKVIEPIPTAGNKR